MQVMGLAILTMLLLSMVCVFMGCDRSERAQGPLMCWVEKECAHMLLQHLVLGFELELYAPEEFCMMFW